MVSETKVKLVQRLVDLINSHSIIGVVNLQDLPAQQLQIMKSTLLSKGITILMARKRILRLALETAGKTDLPNLSEKMKGMPALLFSNENPFALYALLQKSKSEAPAKAGQEAPKDIVVAAGATSFAPGPIISELAAVGIKTKVESGKLSIINDVVVAKEGDKISAKLAETLKRLDLKPMEVGLDLVAVWEDGSVFDAKSLHIDEAEVEQNFILAYQGAFNLAMEIGFLCAETVEPLVQKGFRNAKALALEANIISPDVIEEIIAKAQRQAISVKDEAKLE